MDLFKVAQSILSEESKQNLNDAMFKELQSVFKSHGWELSKIEKKTTRKKVTTAPKKRKVVKKKATKRGGAIKKSLTVGGKEFASIKEFAKYCGKSEGSIYQAHSKGRDLTSYLPEGK